MHFNKILRSECNEKKGNRLKGDLNKNKERQMLRFFRFSCRIICIRYMFSCYACRILYFSLRFYTKKFCLDWKKSKKKNDFSSFLSFLTIFHGDYMDVQSQSLCESHSWTFFFKQSKNKSMKFKSFVWPRW